MTSNGLGGGRWSDSATWRGGAVPTAEDDAVIAARDTVVFDRDDVDKPTCHQLILDPNSNLAFQSGLGRRTLTVDGPIDSFGSIKMHAPGATDEMAIRLVAQTPAERVFKVQKGGALLLLGRADLAGGKRNVTISTPAVAAEKTPAPAELTAVAHTVIDWQNALLEDVAVSVSGIDNTGAKPNERCNFAGNRFLGTSRLTITGCDTAAVVRNEFEARKGLMVRPHALHVYSSPLAEVRSNRVAGQYAIGLDIGYCEATVVGNSVTDCATGLGWHAGTAMLKQNTIRNCKIGLSLRTLTGSVEETEIDTADTPISLAAAKVQFTNTRVLHPADADVLTLNQSSATLLNCNIQPDQVKILSGLPAAKNEALEDPVEALAFVVVSVTGTLPARAQVEVVTAHPEKPLAPGASDLNVRNSPAPVSRVGLTPLPQTLTPLIVKTWRVKDDRQVVPAPEYRLNVLEPATEPGGKARVLKTMNLKPDATWDRPQPNEPKATVEVKLP